MTETSHPGECSETTISLHNGEGVQLACPDCGSVNGGGHDVDSSSEDLDILCHPGQFHVPIANRDWYQKWVDGEIGDEEVQYLADAEVSRLLTQLATHAGGGSCWYCALWAGENEMHHQCRESWRRSITGDEPVDDPEPSGWLILLRPDGTGWGMGWDEDGEANPPPDGLLVDGVGLSVGPFSRSMAALK